MSIKTFHLNKNPEVSKRDKNPNNSNNNDRISAEHTQ